MKSKVEILAPAGSFESLKAAVCAGADAVYMGGTRFGARAYAKNPEEAELLQAIDYVHLHGKKLYLTVNTLLKDREIDGLYEYLLPYYKRGLDAVIVQDVGVLEYVRTYFPELAIHVSTQMTITGEGGARFFKECGAKRVVPARELSLGEIREMKEKTGLEIECFVHGALCYCYSGQCLLSSLVGGRSGNRGQCAQPCRLPYSVGEGKAATLLSLKDLCTVEQIPELMEAGIDSFKIEGRMKQPDYVYTVVSMYRKYVNLYETLCKKQGAALAKAQFRVEQGDKEQLLLAYQRRGYTDGYYSRPNGKEMISFARPKTKEETDKKSGQQNYEMQEKIKGEFILSAGNCATLNLECQGKKISCQGAEVQQAQKQPLTKERVQSQIQKTGGTPFTFDTVEVEIEGDVFLPMQSINEIRRAGLALLERAILSDSDRDEPGTSPADELLAGEKDGKREELAEEPDRTFSVSVQECAQLLEAVSHEEVQRIYVDGSIAFTEEANAAVLKGHREGKQLFLVMPYIFRRQATDAFEKEYKTSSVSYDGVLIRNWESYTWLIDQGYQGEIRSDSNLYLFNRYARAFLKKTRIHSYTAPAELNSRELEGLGLWDCAFPIYGYQPVMVAANCIMKTTARCDKSGGICYVKDRYQKKLMVKNVCKYCYNMIYNCAPLMLLNQREEVLALHPKELRLDFTGENPKQMRQIIKIYAAAFVKEEAVEMPDMEFTKGHFKRGVK